MWSIIHASMQSLPNVRIKRKERYTIIAEACLQSQAPAISNPKYVLLQPLYDFLIHTFPKTQQIGVVTGIGCKGDRHIAFTVDDGYHIVMAGQLLQLFTSAQVL